MDYQMSKGKTMLVRSGDRR